MDEKFYEFLGNLFLNAAKNRRQMDDFIQMSQQGFKGFEEMAELFRKFYGLDKYGVNHSAYMNSNKKTTDFVQPWQNAVDDFQKSFQEYMDAMGIVSKKEHLELVQENEALRKKIADQEETIRNLQILLGEKSMDQGESAKIFQELMEKQSEQFMEMMDTVGGYFKKEDKGKKTDKDENQG